jgi:hypothetical protein
MNLVVFASDAKGLSSLNSIIQEASREGIKVFAVVSNSTTLKYTPHQISDFQILSNVENTRVLKSESLGVFLPFKPDWLLVARERWDPEQSIIQEFKTKFNCKVGLVEPNSWILGNIEGRLETQSRNRFKSLIDAFFTHSTHSAEVQEALGFEGNMIVVGNPKYDHNLSQSEQTIQQVKEYYKVDDTKEKVLLFSLVNSNRSEILRYFKEYIGQFHEKQFFYKPYPGEPFDSKFRGDYYPKFILDNCTPILEESHIWPMFNICDTHIGCMSSIVHSSLLLGKNYIDLSKFLEIDKKYLNTSVVLQENGVGLENNVRMWLQVFGLKSKGELETMLNGEVVNSIKKVNDTVFDSLNTPKKLLSLFDDFNDGNASKRILTYILNDLRK